MVAEVRSFTLDASDTAPPGAAEALNGDGVVCLRSAFDKSWLSTIETGIADAVGGASADVDVVHRDGDEGSFSFSSGAWNSVEGFRSFIFDSRLPDLVWSLLDSSELVLFYDFLLIKQARSDTASTPWHQDHSYYPIDGVKVVNSWVALDDIPVETALRFLAGSHRAQVLYRAVDFDDPEADYRHARTELSVPPVQTGDSEILVAPLKAGDMLLWWSYTLHCAPGNRLPSRRAAFSVNWVGDDVVYNAKPALDTYRESSLQIGGPIICDKFPLVRGGEAAMGRHE
jgi:ectoine hydroxylase-related dioxygenase (phytanoyl-CoA dioxygenase family)